MNDQRSTTDAANGRETHGHSDTASDLSVRPTQGIGPPPNQNRLLASLPLPDYQRIASELEPVPLPLGLVLAEANEPMSHVYFLGEGVASMIANQQEGGDIEVGTIGNEGLVGLPIVLGAESMPTRVFIQIQGHGWRMNADALSRVLDAQPVVRRLFLRYVQFFTDELAQSVACNRLHTLEERCARWLLMTLDRVEATGFTLTHEFLALMLGVRRAGVTIAMGTLQSAGILRYSRGRVTVLDRERLEETSCGCYQITLDAKRRLLG